jgi:hypothetical protein
VHRRDGSDLTVEKWRRPTRCREARAFDGMPSAARAPYTSTPATTSVMKRSSSVRRRERGKRSMPNQISWTTIDVARAGRGLGFPGR